MTQVVTQTRTGGSPGPGARERQVPTPCDSSRLDSVRGGQTSAVARGRKARLPPGWLLLDGGTGSYPGSRRRGGRHLVQRKARWSQYLSERGWEEAGEDKGT